MAFQIPKFMLSLFWYTILGDVVKVGKVEDLNSWREIGKFESLI